MPVCWKCERMQATAELRRTTKGHICKDKFACKTRTDRRKAEAKAARKERTTDAAART